MNSFQDYVNYFHAKLEEIEAIHPTNDEQLRFKLSLVDYLKLEFESWPQEVQEALKSA